MTTVAIVDDNPKAAEAVSYIVEDAGFQPWVFTTGGGTVESVIGEIKQHAQAAICDHRLTALGFASFNGAELAARLINQNMPAILISQFVNQDYDVSIRRWRAIVPAVLSRDECRPETIKDAIELCRLEIAGEVGVSRRKHRTLLRIADKQTEGGEEVIDAILPAWNRQRAVRFPAVIVPPELHGQLKKGAYLITYVNLAATHPEDLFFEGFEKAPEIDERGT